MAYAVQGYTMAEEQLTTEPVDRMTRICDAMTKTFDAHSEVEDSDRCILFIENDERGGIVLHGYEDQYEAIIALLIHLRAIFRANGQELQLIPIPDDLSELDDE